MRVCEFNSLVLSSVALRMVAPRMAALEAAMMVKSLPVMPSRTSLFYVRCEVTSRRELLHDGRRWKVN